MAWFLNHYECDRCEKRWEDEWSCTCDDSCPHCGAKNMSPTSSDDLTEIVVEDGDEIVLMRSPTSAGHHPSYREVARAYSPGGLASLFPNRDEPVPAVLVGGEAPTSA